MGTRVDHANQVAYALVQEAGLGGNVAGLHGSEPARVLAVKEFTDDYMMRFRSYLRVDVTISAEAVHGMSHEELDAALFAKVDEARDRLIRDLRAEADRLEATKK